MNQVIPAAPVEAADPAALTPEAVEMIKHVGEQVDVILNLVAGKPLGVAVAACVEAAVVLITHPATPQSIRVNFAKIFMAQAHELSALVSQEQSDLPQTQAAEGTPLIQLAN